MNNLKQIFILVILFYSCSNKQTRQNLEKNPSFGSETFLSDFIKIDSSEIISKAEFFLTQIPVPITTFVSKRSQGGIHDFYSEGDYWWPNPNDLEGPYIRKDGYTNPANFNHHRKAMRDLNMWVSHLVAAYYITNEEKYAIHALNHLQAFFLDPNTMMNPSLLYAQAIKGLHSGRGIGIIDTIHLIEVAQAIKKLIEKDFLKAPEKEGLKKWFEDYATWLNTHPYGLDEKDHGNNHSTWWATQMAAFASLAERPDLSQVAIVQFKKLLSVQMAEDGSFPDEMERTKPYNYSLFNLEGYAILCHIISENGENLWNYKSTNGTLEKAWNFMLPFIEQKSSWIKEPDIDHFDELPIQSCGLLFAGIGLKNEQMLITWSKLNPEKKSEEIIRNFPLWQPILWLN